MKSAARDPTLRPARQTVTLRNSAPRRWQCRPDPDFRPASYWDATDPAAAITQNIKGQLRREMVRDFISGDAPAILGEIDDELLKDEVSDETRRFLGRMHPSWMGGEYESIFRSVHARGKRPLTLGQLVEFIDNMNMVGERAPTLPYVEACIEYGAEGDIGFATLESDPYPDLGAYYALRLAAWDAGKRGDDDEEEEEVEEVEEEGDDA